MSFIAWHCKFCDSWSRWFRRDCFYCRAAKDIAMDQRQ